MHGNKLLKIDLTTNQLFTRWFYDYLKWRNVHLHFKISRHLLSLNLSVFDNKILFTSRFRIHFQAYLWAKIRYFFVMLSISFILSQLKWMILYSVNHYNILMYWSSKRSHMLTPSANGKRVNQVKCKL